MTSSLKIVDDVAQHPLIDEKDRGNGLFFIITNCLQATPTHDAYHDKGAYAGLTVGTNIIASGIVKVNITAEIQKRI